MPPLQPRHLGAPFYRALVLLVLAMAAGIAAGVWWQQPYLGPLTPLPALLSMILIPWLLGVGALAVLGRLLAAWWAPGLMVSRSLLLLTAVVATWQFGLSWWESGKILAAPQVPLTNLFEVNVFLLILLVLGGLWLEWVERTPAWGVGVAWLAGAVLAFLAWLWGAEQAGPRQVVPALQSYWLPIHVSVTMLAYAAFTLAAAVAGVGLWQWYRRRALAMLCQAETWAFRAISLGFPLLTLGIFLGALWAYEAWGGYWSWDPKETWALITWLIYAAYLHARLQRRLSPLALAWWVWAGFLVMLFCFLGVNIFLSGLHSYGGLI